MNYISNLIFRKWFLDCRLYCKVLAFLPFFPPLIWCSLNSLIFVLENTFMIMIQMFTKDKDNINHTLKTNQQSYSASLCHWSQPIILLTLHALFKSSSVICIFLKQGWIDSIWHVLLMLELNWLLAFMTRVHFCIENLLCKINQFFKTVCLFVLLSFSHHKNKLSGEDFLFTIDDKNIFILPTVTYFFDLFIYFFFGNRGNN